MKTAKTLTLFLTGFCSFITIEVLFRCYSYAASGMMGGLAVLILDRINDEISWDMDLTLQALIGGAVTTLIELIVGLIARYTSIFPQMWDYSDIPFNLGGIICLPFTIAWTLLSVLAIFLADAINYYVFEETPVPHYRIGNIRFRFRIKHCERIRDER